MFSDHKYTDQLFQELLRYCEFSFSPTQQSIFKHHIIKTHETYKGNNQTVQLSQEGAFPRIDLEFWSIYYLFYASMFTVKFIRLGIINTWLVTFGQKSPLNIFMSVLAALVVVFMDLSMSWRY